MNDYAAHRSRLEEEKIVLERELATVGRRNPANQADWEPSLPDAEQEADPNDQADHMEQYGENVAILADLEARYNDVLDALKRMDDGQYGVCSVSGEQIEAERLAADPTARTCMAHLGS